MKTSRDTLWQLIHRLSPAEKRYFKSHFGSPNSQLTRLFDLINAQATYDEAASQDQLAISARHYQVLKVQLQDLLLRSLIAGQAKRNLGSKIRIGLEEVDILLERELFAEAEKRLRRLDTLCKDYGFTLYRYEITEKLQSIIHLEIDIQDEDAQQYYEQLQQLQRTLNQKQQLHAIQMELENWTPFTPHRFAFGQRLLEQLQNMSAEYLDFQSQLEWMQNVAICHEILGQDQQARQYREQILDNFAQEASLRDRLPFNYLRALRYQAAPITGPPASKTVQASIAAAKKLIAHYPQYSPHLIYFYWAEIRSHFYHHSWSKISGGLAKRTCAHLNNYQLIDYGIATEIYLVLAGTHLILEETAEAQTYLDLLHRAKPSRHAYQLLSRSVLQLVLCWEARAYDDLLRLARNHQRRLVRRGLFAQSPFAKALFRFFHRIAQQPSEAAGLSAAFLLKLSAYSTDLLFPYFSFLQLERWLQAVASNRKWRDTLQ